MNIGTLIKNKRKKLSMTQKELAEGICVQGMISKIENNELKPGLDKLEKLAEKLDIPMEYFSNNSSAFDEEENNGLDMKGLIRVIREHLVKREYESIHYLIEAYRTDIEALSTEKEINFFKWINASLFYHKYRNSDKAIEMLKAIPHSDDEKELSIEIINAIGRIHYMREEYKEAIQQFKTGMTYSLNSEVKNFTIFVKLLFNYSLSLYKVGMYREALEVVNKAIDILVEKHSFYLLGDLYYHKGLIFRQYKNYSDAENCYQHAYSLFDIQKNERFKNLAQIELSEIKEERKKNN